MVTRCIPRIYNPSPRSEEKFTVDKRLGFAPAFINSKLPMTKDKGCIYVEYTEVAMVHMIYTMFLD